MNLVKAVWLITVFIPAGELTIEQFGVMQFPPVWPGIRKIKSPVLSALNPDVMDLQDHRVVNAIKWKISDGDPDWGVICTSDEMSLSFVRCVFSSFKIHTISLLHLSLPHVLHIGASTIPHTIIGLSSSDGVVQYDSSPFTKSPR